MKAFTVWTPCSEGKHLRYVQCTTIPCSVTKSISQLTANIREESAKHSWASFFLSRTLSFSSFLPGPSLFSLACELKCEQFCPPPLFFYKSYVFPIVIRRFISLERNPSRKGFCFFCLTNLWLNKFNYCFQVKHETRKKQEFPDPILLPLPFPEPAPQFKL